MYYETYEDYLRGWTESKDLTTEDKLEFLITEALDRNQITLIYEELIEKHLSPEDCAKVLVEGFNKYNDYKIKGTADSPFKDFLIAMEEQRKKKHD